MKDVMRFFQVGVLLALAFCILLAKANDVSTWKIAAISLGIVYAAYKFTHTEPAKPKPVQTKLDRYHFITMYHNGYLSMEELDAALTRCEIEEAKEAAQKALDAQGKGGV